MPLIEEIPPEPTEERKVLQEEWAAEVGICNAHDELDSTSSDTQTPLPQETATKVNIEVTSDNTFGGWFIELSLHVCHISHVYAGDIIVPAQQSVKFSNKR